MAGCSEEDTHANWRTCGVVALKALIAIAFLRAARGAADGAETTGAPSPGAIERRRHHLVLGMLDLGLVASLASL